VSYSFLVQLAYSPEFTGRPTIQHWENDMATRKDTSAGLFMIDLKGLQLTTAQLAKVDKAIQDSVARELAGFVKLPPLVGGPLGPGIRGYFANIKGMKPQL
jgi:hypothetical protein